MRNISNVYVRNEQVASLCHSDLKNIWLFCFAQIGFYSSANEQKSQGNTVEKNWSRVCENEKYVTESVAFRLFNQEQHSS